MDPRKEKKLTPMIMYSGKTSVPYNLIVASSCLSDHTVVLKGKNSIKCVFDGRQMPSYSHPSLNLCTLGSGVMISLSLMYHAITRSIEIILNIKCNLL